MGQAGGAGVPQGRGALSTRLTGTFSLVPGLLATRPARARGSGSCCQASAAPPEPPAGLAAPPGLAAAGTRGSVLPPAQSSFPARRPGIFQRCLSLLSNRARGCDRRSCPCCWPLCVFKVVTQMAFKVMWHEKNRYYLAWPTVVAMAAFRGPEMALGTIQRPFVFTDL